MNSTSLVPSTLLRTLSAGRAYSINVRRRAVNIGDILLENIRRPLLWLLSGVLIGIGFVSVFSGGAVLLLAGLVIGVTLFIRRRGRRRGWPALLYGAGVATAVLLLPYILQPPPCPAGGGAGCYQGFTQGTFTTALVVALAGLAFAVVELRRHRRP